MYFITSTKHHIIHIHAKLELAKTYVQDLDALSIFSLSFIALFIKWYNR